MGLIMDLLSQVVVLGIGWYLCNEGINALKTEQTVVRNSRVTGRWAQVVGILELVVGAPFVIVCVVEIFYTITSAIVH